MVERADGRCTMAIDIEAARHFNPQGVAHGGGAYSLADTAMGGALFSTLDDGFWCATLEIKFNYHVGVREGRLICEASVLHQGTRVANHEALLFPHDRLVASATATFAIFPAPPPPQPNNNLRTPHHRPPPPSPKT